MNLEEQWASGLARDQYHVFRASGTGIGAHLAYRHALLGARLAAGLTQKQLAERAGMKQSVIARLEAGGRLPTLETVQRLATALRMDFVVTAAGTVETRRP